MSDYGIEVDIAVPGRVNLIGEHVDYVGGRVLPIAVDRFVTVSATARDGDVVWLRSAGYGDVMVEAGRPTPTSASWGRYVAAVHAELDVLGRPSVGLAGRIAADLPAAAGLSSSAALVVAVAVASCRVARFTVDPVTLVQACRRAEERATGVPCGPMDQAAVTLARRGHALLLDCGVLTWEHVALPADLGVLVVHSGVERRLEHSAYAQRRAEVDAGDGRRLRHVHGEMERVDAFVAELRADAPDTARLGELFSASHASLAEDFEVSTPELDTLVAIARAEGAFAARLTGAGFGGCIVALTPAGAEAEVGVAVERRYLRATGRAGRAFVCRAVDGAWTFL